MAVVGVAFFMITVYFKKENAKDKKYNILNKRFCQIKLSGPEVIKLFSYSTQLSSKFILLINVKMPTIVGILTFISMINTHLRDLKQETSSRFMSS